MGAEQPMSKFQQTVERILHNNFAFERTVKMLVLGDTSTSKLAQEFAEALQNDAWNAEYVEMLDRSRSGEEPPKEISEKWLDYDVVFCLTKHSLTHTLARRNANTQGVSIITMPGITEDMFLNGAMKADYSIVEKETIEVANKLTQAKSLTVTTGSNSQYTLFIPLEERLGIPSTGVFKKQAASGNLPSGEAFIAPNEYKAEGKIEIKGSIAGIGLLTEPIVLTIEKGRLIEATGEEGKQLLSILGNDDGRLLCELGIGTNYEARVTGLILEDEKAYNTIHVAFGSNHTFGGVINADVHIDCVTIQPVLEWN